jgi:outer membrane lipoprotein-sorting protein
MQMLIEQMVILMLTAAAVAQTTQPAGQPPDRLTPDSTVEQILDALHERGQGLNSLTADVKLTEMDDLGDQIIRTGRVMLLDPHDQTHFRAVFDTRQTETRRFDEKIEYVLIGGTLVERNYPRRIQVRRQVLRPGERMNLLKLGEGPFPLPIGQEREEVLRQFQVEMIDAPESAVPDTLHVRLTPRPGTQLDRRFSRIDVWVNVQDHMPRVIETVDGRQTTTRRTELSDIRINPGLKATHFELERIDESTWRVHDEAFDP